MGAPNKISPRTKEVLARQFSTGRLKTLRDGQQFVQATDRVQVHAETVRRNLQHDREHKRLQPHQVRPMQQAGGGKMMVWDASHTTAQETFPGSLAR
ncbi:hypothetical protein BGX23_004761 [Mortierella sp. AD031]|nr:hypothetical protein BGX23_004761 [Mortierella sp. AD031]